MWILMTWCIQVWRQQTTVEYSYGGGRRQGCTAMEEIEICKVQSWRQGKQLDVCSRRQYDGVSRLSRYIYVVPSELVTARSSDAHHYHSRLVVCSENIIIVHGTMTVRTIMKVNPMCTTRLSNQSNCINLCSMSSAADVAYLYFCYQQSVWSRGERNTCETNHMNQWTQTLLN